MKYAEGVALSLGGSVSIIQRMNLNSCYDPNQSGIGHQPYSWDQYTQMYNRYRVIGCHYRIGMASSSGSGAFQLATLPSNETVTPSTISEARENPRCRYILQGAGAPIRMLTGYVSIPSLVGRTKAQYMADDRYQALTTASPNELAILNIYGGPLQDSTSTDTVLLNIELTYVVEFFDVKNLPQS